MKAVFIRRYGGPEVLEYGEFPDPVVGAGEVLIKVAAAAINPIDIMERSGLTKDFKPISFPGVLGWDLSGTVVRVGPGALGFSIGDKVLAWAYHTYAELCAVKAELLAKVPDGLDLVEAAAFGLRPAPAVADVADEPRRTGGCYRSSARVPALRRSEVRIPSAPPRSLHVPA